MAAETRACVALVRCESYDLDRVRAVVCRGLELLGGANRFAQAGERIVLKPNLLVGGYGQFTYHFNYWGPIGCNRDTHIYVRKLPQLLW